MFVPANGRPLGGEFARGGYEPSQLVFIEVVLGHRFRWRLSLLVLFFLEAGREGERCEV
ncbi:hypothetical protein [Bradyrhizobium sp. OAE829]|uniref:hypothetical protein n=1 Tax=Bradyrhizobium sp. OAE829 TaxID=2663807 RepID=UPI00178B3005